MFNVYVTTAAGDPLTEVVYSIFYSGTVTVPQSCEINAGQTILVNFGALYSGNFSHAGQKPVGGTSEKIQRTGKVQRPGFAGQFNDASYRYAG